MIIQNCLKNLYTSKRPLITLKPVVKKVGLGASAIKFGHIHYLLLSVTVFICKMTIDQCLFHIRCSVKVSLLIPSCMSDNKKMVVTLQSGW